MSPPEHVSAGNESDLERFVRHGNRARLYAVSAVVIAVRPVTKK